MPGSVSLLKAEIERARPVGRKGTYEYSGTVVLHAKSAGLDFTFTSPFMNKDSVAEAIEQAGQILAHELNELVKATRIVLRFEPQPSQDEGAEGPEDDL